MQLLLEICSSTDEMAFIVKYYFHSDRRGRGVGQSLKGVAEQFRERLNRTPPSNIVMLYTVTKFCHSVSVLCHRKGLINQ